MSLGITRKERKTAVCRMGRLQREPLACYGAGEKSRAGSQKEMGSDLATIVDPPVLQLSVKTSSATGHCLMTSIPPGQSSVHLYGE